MLKRASMINIHSEGIIKIIKVLNRQFQKTSIPFQNINFKILVIKFLQPLCQLSSMNYFVDYFEKYKLFTINITAFDISDFLSKFYMSVILDTHFLNSTGSPKQSFDEELYLGHLIKLHSNQAILV